MMASLGVVVYILAVAIPRVGEPESKPNPIREWVHRLPLHHMDATINSFVDKILRKSKIVVMKVDNFITSHINKDKNNSGISGPK